jgi:hypothetical protein
MICRIRAKLSNYKEITLDFIWALRWLFLYRLGQATWRDAKSFRYRARAGTDAEHQLDRVVDDLLAVKRWRWFSHELLTAALREHLLVCRVGEFALEEPLLTFVIPYMEFNESRRRGLELCVQSIAGEFVGKARILIVEQGLATTVEWLKHQFPNGFVEIVLLKRDTGVFERAATLNAGVRQSQTHWVVLHDGDILVPQGWCDFVKQFIQMDYAVVWPALMTLYLDATETARLPKDSPAQAMSCCRELESISILIRKESYLQIGGMDEGFVGWGGEDNEFYERAVSLRVYPQRPLFAVHSWHPLADKNSSQSQANRERMLQLRGEPVRMRIERLTHSSG